MKRRKARECLTQILYQYDLTGRRPDEKELELFWKENPANPSVRDFVAEALRGIFSNLEEIDRMLRESLENWEFERVSPVDRSILRMGIYEILYRDDIPAAVTMNEAIEIAKKFSSTESYSFINGILDNLRKKVGKRLR